GADAKATDHEQSACVRDCFGVELGPRTQADDMGIGDGLEQFGARQRLVVMFDQRVPGGTERLHGTLMDAFQQQNLDVLLGKRCLHGVGEPWVLFVRCFFAPLSQGGGLTVVKQRLGGGCRETKRWNETRTDMLLKRYPLGMLG